MFVYPAKAAFGRPLPKSKIYAFAKPSRQVKDLFVAQVAEIVWKYKISPETVNIPAGRGVPEIEIFGISQKTPEIDARILLTIDKAIRFPIFFELKYGDRIRHVATFKRPSEAAASQWVIDDYFETDWLDAAAAQPRKLPVALNLDTLYEQMVRAYIDIPSRPHESLRDQVARVADLRTRQRELHRLEACLNRERQFSRKVTLNQEVRKLKGEVTRLIGD